jgi:hypothetical protein
MGANTSVSETDRLREQAERCLRLAKATHLDEVAARLRLLAAENLERATELEARARQQPET